MTGEAPKFPTREEREMAKLEFGEKIRAHGFDGPVELPAGDPISMMFGGAHNYVVCLGCGAAVFLNDPMERPESEEPIERGIFLHYAFHERLLDTDHIPGADSV